MAWSTHTPGRCIFCGQMRPRTWTKYGKAHKRCIIADERARQQMARAARSEVKP